MKHEITDEIISSQVVKQEDLILPKQDITDDIWTRPEILDGRTYKISSPYLSESLYVIINNDNGNIREVFIKTKDPTISEYLDALTRVLSSILRLTEKPEFIIEEMMRIQSINSYFKNGRNYKSLMSNIGWILKQELERITNTTIDINDTPPAPEFCIDCE